MTSYRSSMDELSESSSPPPSSIYSPSSSHSNIKSKDSSEKPNWADSGVCVDSGLCLDIPSNSPAFELDNPFKPDSDGDTLLHLAIIQALPDLVSSIIKEAPSSDYLDITNDEFQTPIHLATITKQYDVIKQLISAGASISIRDRNGNTPVHIASKNDDFRAVQLLLNINKYNRQHHLNPINTSEILNIKNYEGETCIHLAVKTANRNLIELLVHCGADVNAQEGKSGKTVLHYAAASHQPDLVTFLIQTCKCSPNVRNYGGLTPMQLLKGPEYDSETDYYSDSNNSEDNPEEYDKDL